MGSGPLKRWTAPPPATRSARRGPEPMDRHSDTLRHPVARAELPYVTIAMPCLNETAYVEACMRSVLAQDYPADRMEVLVADGGSTDGTLTILDRLMTEDPRVRVVPNPRRNQAAGM